MAENNFNIKKQSWGWAPAILAAFVTFALGVASAESIAKILEMPWLFWPLCIGFIAAESMILAYFWRPQQGVYTKKQMKGIQAAKYVIMGAGLIDGVLLIINAKTGGANVFLVSAQAGVSLFAIFFSAGASMWVIDNDKDRQIAINNADLKLMREIESNKYKTQREMDSIELKRIRLKANTRAKNDVMRYTLSHLGSREMQDQFKAAGEAIGNEIFRQYNARVDNLLERSKPSFMLEESKEGRGEVKIKKALASLAKNGNGLSAN